MPHLTNIYTVSFSILFSSRECGVLFLGLRILLSFARAHNIVMCSVLCPSTFLLKIMFYNILINQAVTKLFQKTCEKTVDIFGLNCNMRYFCTRFPRDGKPCNWHSDRNGVRTLTFFFPFALIPTKNTAVEKKKEKKLSKTFGRYVLKFLPLHPLSERNAIDDWLAD